MLLIALTNGEPVLHEGVVRDEAHDRCGDEHVEHGAQRCSENGGSSDVATRIVDTFGGDGRCLDADEGEEGDARRDADGAIEAAAGGIKRTEVRVLNKEPANDADKEQRHELQYDRNVLKPRHLANARQS